LCEFCANAPGGRWLLLPLFLFVALTLAWPSMSRMMCVGAPDSAAPSQTPAKLPPQIVEPQRKPRVAAFLFRDAGRFARRVPVIPMRSHGHVHADFVPEHAGVGANSLPSGPCRRMSNKARNFCDIGTVRLVAVFVFTAGTNSTRDPASRRATATTAWTR
jgi:hypothetical protein